MHLHAKRGLIVLPPRTNSQADVVYIGPVLAELGKLLALACVDRIDCSSCIANPRQWKHWPKHYSCPEQHSTSSEKKDRWFSCTLHPPSKKSNMLSEAGSFQIYAEWSWLSPSHEKLFVWRSQKTLGGFPFFGSPQRVFRGNLQKKHQPKEIKNK